MLEQEEQAEIHIGSFYTTIHIVIEGGNVKLLGGKSPNFSCIQKYQLLHPCDQHQHKQLKFFHKDLNLYIFCSPSFPYEHREDLYYIVLQHRSNKNKLELTKKYILKKEKKTVRNCIIWLAMGRTQCSILDQILTDPTHSHTNSSMSPLPTVLVGV